MPAGTIALTNNSAAVTGTGTSFTTELKVGDFVGVIVGGAPYTLVVSSIASNTQLALGVPFNGPTTSGLAWYAVPASLMVAVTQQSLNDMSKVLRGMILDKANWQQIFTGSGNVTVNLSDGTSWTGPAWNGISSTVSGKMDKSQNLNDVADKPTARSNLGLGDAATKSVGSAANTVAAGNDARFVNFTVTQSPKNIVVSNSFRWDVPAGLICHGGANSASRTSVFTIDWTSGGGTHIFIDSTDMGQVQFITSDERLKTKIQPAASGFVDRVKSQEVVEYEWIDKKMRGSNRLRGFIAQRVGKVDPMLMNGSEEGQYGLEIIGLLADAYGAIQEQQTFIETQATELEELKARMKAIDCLDS
ncbi:tail fiber domain-containing protein [Pantoea sp. RHCKP32]|uniref:tail fiber domain-containing protein n=1 Tax=Pantoea sp. RHCKP32 TaxID=3425182 RepID=UPI003DA16DB1